MFYLKLTEYKTRTHVLKCLIYVSLNAQVVLFTWSTLISQNCANSLWQRNIKSPWITSRSECQDRVFVTWSNIECCLRGRDQSRPVSCAPIGQCQLCSAYDWLRRTTGSGRATVLTGLGRLYFCQVQTGFRIDSRWEEVAWKIQFFKKNLKRNWYSNELVVGWDFSIDMWCCHPTQAIFEFLAYRKSSFQLWDEKCV